VVGGVVVAVGSAQGDTSSVATCGGSLTVGRTETCSWAAPAERHSRVNTASPFPSATVDADPRTCQPGAFVSATVAPGTG
jgi:hypothetical protein